MATVAIAKRQDVWPRAIVVAPLALGLAGLALGWSGAGWDVAWHRLIGRDTFWSPPHIGLYLGTTLNGLAALIAAWTAASGRPVRGPELRIGPIRGELGLALVGFGALAIIASAPFDDLWHRMFGRDIDIWSPPHLAGVAGGAIVYTGWILALGANVFDLSPRLRVALATLVLAGFTGVVVFGTNFYYIMGWAREGFLYPLLVGAAFPFVLALATRALSVPWSATAVALTYTALALTTFGVLRAFGWPPPAFPPLIVAGAVALDVARRRASSPVALGAVFCVAVVIAEGLRLALFAPPPPTQAALQDGQAGALLTHYWEQATTRTWLSAWPILAAAVATPLAALTWSAGRALGRLASPDA